MLNRSFLFVPSHIQKYVDHADKSKADYIVLDLEDAVPEKFKKFARENISKKIKNLKNKNILVRINELSLNTEREIYLTYQKNLKGFVLPKIKSKKDIKRFYLILKKILKKNINKIELFPLIENSKAIINLDEIIVSSKNIKGLIFGHEDYLVDTKGDIKINNDSLLYARLKIVNYCRAHNIIPIDMGYLNIKDMKGCREFTLESKSLGFAGMIAVYPKQLDIINRTFSPSKQEVIEAKNLVKEFKTKKKSIFLNNKGKYFGPPHLKKAEYILSNLKKIK